MYERVFEWLFDFTKNMGGFMNWLFTEIDIEILGNKFGSFSPIGVFGIGFISAVLIAEIVHLFTV